MIKTRYPRKASPEADSPDTGCRSGNDKRRDTSQKGWRTDVCGPWIRIGRDKRRDGRVEHSPVISFIQKRGGSMDPSKISQVKHLYEVEHLTMRQIAVEL